MRRVLVIFLIFLFPLQVFAALLDNRCSLHSHAADHLMLSDPVFHAADSTEALADPANLDADNELPNSADVNDSLDQGTYFHLINRLVYTKPQFASLSRHLLFLPVAKPPPNI